MLKSESKRKDSISDIKALNKKQSTQIPRTLDKRSERACFGNNKMHWNVLMIFLSPNKEAIELIKNGEWKSFYNLVYQNLLPAKNGVAEDGSSHKRINLNKRPLQGIGAVTSIIYEIIQSYYIFHNGPFWTPPLYCEFTYVMHHLLPSLCLSSCSGRVRWS